MILLYHLARWEKGEYVHVEVRESQLTGVSSLVPERSLGENYKVLVAVIEEYEALLKESKPDNLFGLLEDLKRHFPNHPKIVFSLSCAILELFCKKVGLELEEMFRTHSSIEPKEVIRETRSDLVFVEPEALGHVLEVMGIISLLKSTGKDVAVVKRTYPDPTTNVVLNFLSKIAGNFCRDDWR